MRAPLLAAVCLLLCAPLAGCVDHTRGAVVQMNIARDALALDDLGVDADGQPTGTGTHHALYAFLGGGPVLVAQFKVLDNIDDCQQDDRINTSVQLVQRYVAPGEGARTVCNPDRRLGALDTINLAASQLVGGIRLTTAIDLGDAERMIVTRQDDSVVDPFPALDPAPGPAVLVADVAPEVAPYDETCVDDDPTPRRGVVRGVFVRAPDTTPCGGRIGAIAIVPAVDDTFF